MTGNYVLDYTQAPMAKAPRRDEEPSSSETVRVPTELMNVLRDIIYYSRQLGEKAPKLTELATGYIRSAATRDLEVLKRRLEKKRRKTEEGS